MRPKGTTIFGSFLFHETFSKLLHFTSKHTKYQILVRHFTNTLSQTIYHQAINTPSPTTTMSEKTFSVTSEDVRKMESQESKFHGGDIPKDSDTAAMKVRISRSMYTSTDLAQQILSEQESKEDQIARVKANLPLPDQPVGGASADLQSADQRTVNVGTGGVDIKLGTQSSSGLREPATADSSARIDGEGWKKPTAP